MHRMMAKESAILRSRIPQSVGSRQGALRTLHRTQYSLLASTSERFLGSGFRPLSPPLVIPFSLEKRSGLHSSSGAYAFPSRVVLRSCEAPTHPGFYRPSLSVLLKQQQNRAVRVRSFHSTPRAQAVHHVVFLLGFLKTSTALSGIKMGKHTRSSVPQHRMLTYITVARVLLSLLPVFLLKKFRVIKVIHCMCQPPPNCLRI